MKHKISVVVIVEELQNSPIRERWFEVWKPKRKIVCTHLLKEWVEDSNKLEDDEEWNTLSVPIVDLDPFRPHNPKHIFRVTNVTW